MRPIVQVLSLLALAVFADRLAAAEKLVDRVFLQRDSSADGVYRWSRRSANHRLPLRPRDCGSGVLPRH